nr:integrase, catalytic region, zinc finger, CCHC-type, peptidase aspartic, catalytic [Tanacetum cinerariifolium]
MVVSSSPVEADDQAIQTILLGLPEDIYAAVDSCETAQEIWESIESYYHHFLKLMNDLKRNKHFPEKIAMLHQDQPSFNQNYMQQPIPNPKDITDVTTAMNMALALMAKAFKLNYSTPTNNNQRISSNLHNRQISQPGMNMGQDRQMQMVGGDGGNQFRQYAEQNVGNLNGYNDVQNVGNQVIQNAIQNPRIQNVGNQNGLIGILRNTNQNLNRNGNLVAARAEGNAIGHNCNQIRCYNYRGVGHFARNFTVRPRKRDAAYLQTQLLIAQKEEAGIQLQAEEFDLMAVAANLEIEEVNANCILMANLQQASTSGTQTDKALVYDSDGSTEKMALGYQNPFYLKQAQQKQQSLYNGKVLLEKHDPPVVHDSKETLQLAQESRVKMKQLNKEIKPANYTKINHLSGLYKIVKDEIFPIVNQVDARVQNFEIQFLKEVAKLVGDFKSLVKEADESLAKHKALELEIERLLRAVKKCEECKFNKISYDKAYNDIQQKIEWLQAQLGDLKGKSKDTSCVSDTLNPLSQKLENKNVELEFQVSDRKDTVCGKSANTKFAKQSILKKPPKVGETHALSKPITSSSIPTPQGSKVVKNDKVIAPGMFRIKPFKPSREEKHVPNQAKGSTRRPQPRSNTKNDRVHSASKSSQSKNKEVKVEEHHRKLLLSRTKKHMSFECNNVKLATQNVKSKVVCAMSKEQHPKVKKTKKVGSIERLASPKPSKPRSFLRVYFIQGFGHNLFSVRQFCDSDLEEHLCPSCEQGKSKRESHPPKPVPNSRQRLHLLHMDLSGPMRIASINGKRYVLVIVDDYSRYTWVHFLRSKDEASEVIITFLKRITILLQSTVIIISIDNGTEFKNQALKKYFDSVGISHQMSSVRTPQQNRVVEQRNQTLVEAARTMLIFSCAPLFLWAEAIATACFTQNRSIIHCRFNKTPYKLINGRKPNISFLHVFGALCYPKNDREDIGKLGAKGDIGFFIGYFADSCAYRVFNRRTKKIIETMNVSFDELSAMALEQRSSKPGLQSMTSGQISSGLDLTYAPSTITSQQPTEGELNLLFEAMYDDYIGGQPSGAPRTVLAAQAHQDSGFELTGFSDADYAGCKDTFKSTSGGAQFLGEKLLTDYGFHFNKIPIYCDSKSAIAISCNLVQHSRTKHIVVRYHFIKEHMEKGTIELYFVKMDYQLDDLFTKVLPADRFNYLVCRLGMRSLSPQELDRFAKSQ